MANRSISVKGTTYDRIKAHTDRTGQSVSAFITDLVDEKLAAASQEQGPRNGSSPQPADGAGYATF